MNNQLLHLMHLVSPALPVGAYAYSQGLEYAVDSGWLAEPGKLQHWITGVLEHSVGHLDLPVLLRLYRAWDAAALDEVDQWNDFVRANRETAELLLEDEQLGLALQRLSVSLQTKGADTPLSSPPCFITQFALAGVRRHIAEEDLLYGFAWSWLENQVAAATKIVPLGQTQAQQTLVAMMEKIPAVCAHALTLQDEELGVGLPALAMASSRHERQYSRLFRS